MRPIITLLRKDLANFTRDKAAMSLTFVVPMVLIYIFGHVFGLKRTDSGPRGVDLAVVNASTQPAAQKLVTALQAEQAFRVQTTRRLDDGTSRPLTEADARALILNRRLRFAVVIPADVIRDDTLGIRLRIFSNPQNEIETQTVNGLLQKTIFANVPELLGQSLQAQARREIGPERLTRFNDAMAGTIATAFGGDREVIRRSMDDGTFGLATATTSSPGADANASAAGKGTASAFREIVKLETETLVGQTVKSPAATRLVGGWAIMFLLFALSSSASSFFDEKKSGIFQRLLAAPLRRSHLLWSRFLWGVLLGLVQLTALFLAGWWLYDIDVFTNFGNLVLMSVATAAACTAFGMLLVAVTSSPAAASGLATFLILTMSACGGAWFPLSMMPDFMQQAARFTLVYWALEGFAQVLWAGDSLGEILPTLGVLSGMAAVVMAFAVWRFNRGRLFE